MSGVIVAFDDFIHGSFRSTTTAYSSSFFNALLGEMEAYAIEAIIDGIPGASDGSLAIQIETSGDGRNWSNKNSRSEIGAASVSGGITTVATAADANVRPGCALVRLRLDLSSSVGTPGAKVVVYVREQPDPKFVPTRLAGCTLWLRADLGVDLAGSPPTLVQNWRDLSGAGHDAAQATATRQPTYNTTQINGLPTVFFDASSAGAERIMSLNGSLSLSSAHIFFVGQSVSPIAPTQPRTGIWRFGSSGLTSHLPYLDGIIYDDFGSNARYTCGSPVAGITSPYCYEVQASSTWSSFLNGSAQFTNTPNTVAWSGTLELGGNSGTGIYFDGHLAEVILYDHVLQSGDRDAIVFYLNQRYALGMV